MSGSPDAMYASRLNDYEVVGSLQCLGAGLLATFRANATVVSAEDGEMQLLVQFCDQAFSGVPHFDGLRDQRP